MSERWPDLPSRHESQISSVGTGQGKRPYRSPHCSNSHRLETWEKKKKVWSQMFCKHLGTQVLARPAYPPIISRDKKHRKDLEALLWRKK